MTPMQHRCRTGLLPPPQPRSRAEFRLAHGLIAEHRDSFSFYAWARQALGPTGLALGWTPILRGKVQRQARAGLDEFLAQASA
jgi:hypothetical protein